MATDQTDFRLPGPTDSVDRAVEAVRRFSRSLWLDLLRRDQSERWQSGAGALVESYFERLPELREDPEEVLVLICGEVRALRAAGVAVTLVEYQRRFPELSEELAMQFELDAAMDSSDDDFEAADGEESESFQLPGFRVLREIGRGTSGVVYVARQLSIDRLVAIKAMYLSVVDAKQLGRQRQEASILSRMKHPHVVQIYDVIEANGMLCSVIEYVDGPTLAELTGGKPLSPREAARLVKLLAEAMHAVHETGILHRDLKPSNVLMTSNGEPKITDFGLAKLLAADNRLTTHNCLLGTPSYMPPETAAGNGGAADRAGDVYSLGAILYELLTGRPPFLGATVLDTLSLIRERDPVPPRTSLPFTPRDLETICLKCLEKSPQQRYPTAAALADDLGSFLQGAAIQARRRSAVEKAWRWCRRNPVVATLAASLLLAVAVGFCGVLWQWSQAELARRSESAARAEADDRAREISQGLERLKRANALLERGHRYIVDHNWDDADAAFTRAIALRPDHIQAWEARGEFLYARLGVWDLAAHDFARAYELQKPQNSHRWWWNAMIRAYVGDLAGYRAVCRQMKEHSHVPGVAFLAPELVRALALVPAQSNEVTFLVDSGDAIANCYPRDGLYAYLQGLAHFRAGDSQGAIENCRRSLALEGSGFRPELNYPILALAYGQLGRKEEAQSAFDSGAAVQDRWIRQRYETDAGPWVLRLGATDQWPVSVWDWLEFQFHMREASQALHGTAWEEDPREIVLRARALAGLRHFDRADVEYRAALARMPDDVNVQCEAHRNRAYYLVRFKDYRPVAEEFAKASALRPDDVRLLEFVAISHLAAGDETAYRADCEQLLARFSNTTNPTVAHAIVDACVLKPNAIRDIKRLIPLGRVAATAYLGSVRVLGAACFRAGAVDEAIACFDQAAKLNSVRPDDLIFLSMLHHQSGRDAEAERYLAAAEKWIAAADQADEDAAPGSQPTWGGWYEKVNVPILLAEARALIRDGNGEPHAAAIATPTGRTVALSDGATE
jgi:tetratricopeptide (TPR) repeat protein/predicted Ser/Thr protein kinase